MRATISLKDATGYAIRAGATQAEIDKEANFQKRSVGSVPSRNMVRALIMTSRLNVKDDWVRLAGTLQARRMKK